MTNLRGCFYTGVAERPNRAKSGYIAPHLRLSPFRSSHTETCGRLAQRESPGVKKHQQDTCDKVITAGSQSSLLVGPDWTHPAGPILRGSKNTLGYKLQASSQAFPAKVMLTCRASKNAEIRRRETRIQEQLPLLHTPGTPACRTARPLD